MPLVAEFIHKKERKKDGEQNNWGSLTPLTRLPGFLIYELLLTSNWPINAIMVNV